MATGDHAAAIILCACVRMSELRAWVVAVGVGWRCWLGAGVDQKKPLSKLGRKRCKRLRGLMKTGRDDGGEEAGRDVCSRVGRELREGKGGRKERSDTPWPMVRGMTG